MPKTIAKECPGCGRVTTEPKQIYKMLRRVFSGSICACGHERKFPKSSWTRKTDKKRKPRICDSTEGCGCGHEGHCVFPKLKAVPDLVIKCMTPDCMSSASVEFQRRILGY